MESLIGKARYLINWSSQRAHTVEGGITVRLVASLTGLDLTKQLNMVSTTESKQVKLETNRTVILPPAVSVLRSHI